MSKQLRLDVAQLTDVGRKRPHNEDNMAYVIPKDPQAMGKKGALFIVADGMGGHAAGEVASEIAVDTVSKSYYQYESEDISSSLLYAIKRANTLIHQRAAENMLRSGMGTTCVAAVMCGGTAYIANVGDSRAYMIRAGQGKQVSQDHSWVEEQVRAGLLTRDQARSHAQRNVITRCLGTQADVDVDIFTEQLQEGDTLILCSDGLSGLVGEDELQAIAGQYMPQESVYRLVERANENGGPDNITAIVMRVLEVGPEPPNARSNVRYPVPVGGGGRDSSEEATAVLGSLPSPTSTRVLSGHLDDVRVPTASAPMSVSSGPLSPPNGAVSQQPPISPVRPRHSRMYYPTLALVVLLLVGLLGGGGYFGWRLLFPPPNAGQLLSQARANIEQAKAETTTNPSDALQKLANAQKNLRDVQGAPLTDAQQQQASTLFGDFTPAVKSAIISYNQHALISTLPCSNTTTVAVSNGSTRTQAGSIVAIQGGKGKVFYTLAQDHSLYQIDEQHSLVNKWNAPANTNILMIAGVKQRLFLLTSQVSNNTATYSLHVVIPTASDPYKDVQTIVLDSYTKDGAVPTQLAVWEPDVYLTISSPASQNSATLLDIPIGSDNKQGTILTRQISVSASIASIAAMPDHRLFLLYNNGGIQSYQFTSGQAPASIVVHNNPIAPPLAVSAKDFSATTDVPKASLQSSDFLTVTLPSTPSSTFLLTGLVDTTPHLYIVDGQQNRVLDLKVAPSATTATPAATTTATIITATSGTGGGIGAGSPPITMELVQQYASPTLLSMIKGAAPDPVTPTLYILSTTAQNTSAISLLAVDVSLKTPCDAGS